jgi:hypothetical protein
VFVVTLISLFVSPVLKEIISILLLETSALHALQDATSVMKSDAQIVCLDIT